VEQVGAALDFPFRGREVIRITALCPRVRYSEFSMGGFSILTNRKRAIVALVHSVVFLLIAVPADGGGESGGGDLGTVAGTDWDLDSVRDLCHCFLDSLVAAHPIARMAGEVLFRVLHDQRDVGAAANRIW